MRKTIRLTATRRDEIDLDKLAAALLRLAREQAAKREAEQPKSAEVRHD